MSLSSTLNLLHHFLGQRSCSSTAAVSTHCCSVAVLTVVGCGSRGYHHLLQHLQEGPPWITYIADTILGGEDLHVFSAEVAVFRLVVYFAALLV